MSDPVIEQISLIDARIKAEGFTALFRHEPVLHAEAVPEIDAYAIGFSEGQSAAASGFAAERNALIALLASADALQAEPSEELAAMIAATIAALVTQCVGAAAVSPEWLVGRIKCAMACIEEADRAQTLWLHPDDVALVATLDLGLDIQADPSSERGSLRIDCSRGWIEDRRSDHLVALRAALGVEAG